MSDDIARTSAARTGASALFAEFIASSPPDARAALDALCRAHPEVEHELRRHYVEHERRERARAHPGPRVRLADELRMRFGDGVDPAVTIGGERVEAESGSSSELLERLRAHAPRTSRYTLSGEVGRGGMGTVLKVWDEDLRRSLAMKVALGTEPAASDAKAVDARTLARFLEEAQVTGQLDHPGIVPVHELGLDQDGRVYFTMKLVRGRDLRAIYELVVRGLEGWSRERALGVLLKTCEALAFAHKKGVLHRDVKPANVMVGDFGEVYVMDWGLARVIGRADRHDLRIAPESRSRSVRTERREEREETPDSPIVTMDGDVVGTPAYMAPEQARGEVNELTARADVYAVGAMLYHLLTGQMPYVPPGARVSNRTVLAMVLQGPPTRIESLRKDVPAELVAICEKAMARDASERYADTLELAEDLRAYLENRVVRAHSTGAWVELRKWIGRNRGMAWMIGLFVLFVGIGGVSGTIYFQRQAHEEERRSRRERAMLDVVSGRELLQRAERLRTAAIADVEPVRAWLASVDELLTRNSERDQVAQELRNDPVRTSSATAIEDFVRAVVPDLERAQQMLAKRRLEGATIRERILAQAGHDLSWTEASLSIASWPGYGGLTMTAQAGLVPLGADPESGLWEFWHTATGDRPVRDPKSGRWIIAGSTGLVLVLLPGGTTSIGSLPVTELMRVEANAPKNWSWDLVFALAHGASDGTVPWRDPGYRASEELVRGVSLEPFFISKYEMTRGQWMRLAGADPSKLKFGMEYPVESVSWIAANDAMRSAGFELPTESQWEYACRASTTSPFWTGWTIESLLGAANVADMTFKKQARSPENESTQLLDDGIATLARADAHRPNPFGLHNVHGNVWEWCADPFAESVVPRAGDGWNQKAPNDGPATIRGGSFFTHPVDARSANRFGKGLDRAFADTDLGLRPARAIDR